MAFGLGVEHPWSRLSPPVVYRRRREGEVLKEERGRRKGGGGGAKLRVGERRRSGRREGRRGFAVRVWILVWESHERAGAKEVWALIGRKEDRARFKRREWKKVSLSFEARAK